MSDHRISDAGILKIQFRRFDKCFAQVDETGPQEGDDKCFLQCEQVFFDKISGQTDILPDFIDLAQSGRLGSGKTDQTVEGGYVFYL